MNQITDLFTYLNKDGSVQMYKIDEVDEKVHKLYIVNNYGKKITQLIINTEKNNRDEKFASIKIIPYDIKQANIFTEKNELKYTLKNLEITYHGSSDLSKTPKIHLKYLDKKGYTTIIDSACEIKENTESPIPLFSIFVGNLYIDKTIDKIKKRTSTFNIDTKESVKLDFYISKNNFNMERFINSMYSFSMFYSFDYLISQKNNPLQYVRFPQPIQVYKFKDFTLFVRCTLNNYSKKPYFQFYNNKDFYNNYLNRGMKSLNSDGTVNDTVNMLDKENELEQENKKLFGDY